MARSRRVLGDNHPDTLITLSNLAMTHEAIGDLYAAYELHKQTLNRRQRVLGEDHPDTQDSLKRVTEVRRQLDEL